MTREELQDEVIKLIRASIRRRLKIPNEHYESSLDAQAAVTRCLSTVMAIGGHSGLEAAVDELFEFRSLITPSVCRTELEDEVEAAYATFRIEVAAFTRMRELNDAQLRPSDILSLVVALLDEGDEA